MKKSTETLFQEELKRRGIPFSYEQETDRYVVEWNSGVLSISLANLVKDMALDFDPECVVRFVDSAILSDLTPQSWPQAMGQIFLALEPNDYVECPDMKWPLSDRVDKVLVLYNQDLGTITWMTNGMLDDWGIDIQKAVNVALQNLSDSLRLASLQCEHIDGVSLGMLGTTLPFKAALILAPNLREILEPALGWPLLSVVPDRNFLYFWGAAHKDFAGRVGRVIVREYLRAAYPISTEVYSITDSGVEAIGEFEVPTKGNAND